MRFFRNNGLLITVFAIFVACLVGQAISGYFASQQDRAMHGLANQSFASFLGSGEFQESVFENWESEFLEKWAYVFLTAYLVQRGSAESRDPDADSPENEDPARHREDPDAPWPVRRGGIILWLYSHSLGTALFLIFVATFVFHLWQSTRHAAEEAALHHRPAETILAHLVSGQFWFESFQNWQSEFLSTGVLVLLAIWLRERGSPESKPVHAPHAKTGH
ncbi:hypothetical protein FJ420_07475 [Mesorhizobium sp. B3-1-3]|uniref:DUF6766 family protein n=1 Tax=unclassified Mesorhizobium TaxID=325217 RepID=UPI0011295162|nr:MULTISPECIES: DUF6766 family protein [unclassified Mesorhizobium]TPI69687.1 hypothetical protein FJ424_05620 [Mesorhizobium sp. B3-1-8]TPI73878.1 hypothetical protein FJ420_07475 [Mesorhizobium sp. B3-1-3]